ncbi:MAG TPA: CHAT domain-containing protein, partial [Thermoanaerobaculia bacterium]|nr:CHAT domain-containing protein [Thermoanaerobaculia bacterium]
FFASRREHHELAVDLLMRLAGSDPGGGHEAAAFLASERAHARGLLDLMAEGRIGAGRELPRALREREVEIDARLSQVQNLLIRELSEERPDPTKVGKLRRELRQAEEQRQDLEARIRREHRRYAQARYGEPLPLSRIQPLLDAETALLEYVIGQEASYLFAVTREGMTTHRLPPAGEIARLVRAARAGLEAPDSPRRLRSYAAAARGLHDRLIAPARRTLAGKRHLLVAADRSLHLLAFETLLSADAAGRPAHELPYLAREYAVTYVPSATVWAELMESRRQRPPPDPSAKRLLAVADPLNLSKAPAPPGQQGAAPPAGVTRTGRGLLDADRWSWSRLEGSGREVQRIAGLYPRGDVALYIGAEATEENLKGSRWLSDAHRLHFATHGIISETQPELSALQLTRAEGSREDGLLQAYEIFDLRLGADLVVLSACETALGKQVTGEGLMGLTRAFLHAGAASVVVSLWPVADDSATPDLMVSFYRRLDRSRDAARRKAEALQAAKLDLIREKQYAHPYYWAPFILVGEPE